MHAFLTDPKIIDQAASLSPVASCAQLAKILNTNSFSLSQRFVYACSLLLASGHSGYHQNSLQRKSSDDSFLKHESSLSTPNSIFLSQHPFTDTKSSSLNSSSLLPLIQVPIPNPIQLVLSHAVYIITKNSGHQGKITPSSSSDLESDLRHLFWRENYWKLLTAAWSRMELEAEHLVPTIDLELILEQVEHDILFTGRLDWASLVGEEQEENQQHMQNTQAALWMPRLFQAYQNISSAASAFVSALLKSHEEQGGPRYASIRLEAYAQLAGTILNRLHDNLHLARLLSGPSMGLVIKNKTTVAASSKKRRIEYTRQLQKEYEMLWEIFHVALSTLNALRTKLDNPKKGLDCALTFLVVPYVRLLAVLGHSEVKTDQLSKSRSLIQDTMFDYVHRQNFDIEKHFISKVFKWLDISIQEDQKQFTVINMKRNTSDNILVSIFAFLLEGYVFNLKREKPMYTKQEEHRKRRKLDDASSSDVHTLPDDVKYSLQFFQMLLSQCERFFDASSSSLACGSWASVLSMAHQLEIYNESYDIYEGEKTKSRLMHIVRRVISEFDLVPLEASRVFNILINLSYAAAEDFIPEIFPKLLALEINEATACIANLVDAASRNRKMDEIFEIMYEHLKDLNPILLEPKLSILKSLSKHGRILPRGQLMTGVDLFLRAFSPENSDNIAAESSSAIIIHSLIQEVCIFNVLDPHSFEILYHRIAGVISVFTENGKQPDTVNPIFFLDVLQSCLCLLINTSAKNDQDQSKLHAHISLMKSLRTLFLKGCCDGNAKQTQLSLYCAFHCTINILLISQQGKRMDFTEKCMAKEMSIAIDISSRFLDEFEKEPFGDIIYMSGIVTNLFEAMFRLVLFIKANSDQKLVKMQKDSFVRKVQERFYLLKSYRLQTLHQNTYDEAIFHDASFYETPDFGSAFCQSLKICWDRDKDAQFCKSNNSNYLATVNFVKWFNISPLKSFSLKDLEKIFKLVSLMTSAHASVLSDVKASHRYILFSLLHALQKLLKQIPKLKSKEMDGIKLFRHLISFYEIDGLSDISSKVGRELLIKLKSGDKRKKEFKNLGQLLSSKIDESNSYHLWCLLACLQEDNLRTGNLNRELDSICDDKVNTHINSNSFNHLSVMKITMKKRKMNAHYAIIFRRICKFLCASENKENTRDFFIIQNFLFAFFESRIKLPDRQHLEVVACIIYSTKLDWGLLQKEVDKIFDKLIEFSDYTIFGIVQHYFQDLMKKGPESYYDAIKHVETLLKSVGAGGKRTSLKNTGAIIAQDILREIPAIMQRYSLQPSSLLRCLCCVELVVSRSFVFNMEREHVVNILTCMTPLLELTTSGGNMLFEEPEYRKCCEIFGAFLRQRQILCTGIIHLVAKRANELLDGLTKAQSYCNHYAMAYSLTRLWERFVELKSENGRKCCLSMLVYSVHILSESGSGPVLGSPKVRAVIHHGLLILISVITEREAKNILSSLDTGAKAVFRLLYSEYKGGQ